MKKIYLITLAFAFASNSCSDWLNITPELEIRKDNLYTTQQGFMDVLTGAYIRMSTPALYGANTSMVLPELMAQNWTLKSNHITSYIGNFDFTQSETKALLETIWLQYYQTITNLNSLLEEIDANRDLFQNGNYELVKGEAIGLRAFLHFEMLRFWGSVPEDIDMGAPSIPYVTSVTKNPNELRMCTYREVFDHILADLTTAGELLKNDPVIHYPISVLNRVPISYYYLAERPTDEYHFYRNSRFNIYAVKATLARYYMWIGGAENVQKAVGYAMEVISATDPFDNMPKFKLGANSDAAQRGGLIFPTEHIFAACNSIATQTLAPVFFTYTTAYSQDIARLRTAYESTIHPFDIRFRDDRLWQARTYSSNSASTFLYFMKYNVTEATAVEDVPLIRLSEMYFIAIEGGRTDLFRDYRVARGLDSSIDDSLLTPDAIRSRLELEYRKDFFGEGQMFFFYKRLAYERFTWPVTKQINRNDYKLPIPQSQTLFE